VATTPPLWVKIRLRDAGVLTHLSSLERERDAVGYRSAEDIVRAWVEEKVDAVLASKVVTLDLPPPKVALVCLPGSPLCDNLRFSRGLCRRHYQRARYFESKRLLSEGWLVRHGRMLPARGRDVRDYAVVSETLETLPGKMPDDAPETRWMFGWPEVQKARAVLEGAMRS
jgi:hypothetical protein